MKVIGIILFSILVITFCAFIGYEIYSIIKTLKERKLSRKDKSDIHKDVGKE